VLIGHGPIDSSLVDGVDQGAYRVAGDVGEPFLSQGRVSMKGSIGERKTTASPISESWLVARCHVCQDLALTRLGKREWAQGVLEFVVKRVDGMWDVI
jgi:hypothetical protein